jgi:hypothetical protein
VSPAKDRRSPKQKVELRRAAASAARAAELAAARRRTLVAKTVLSGTGAVLFAAGMLFARHAYAGHQKQPTTALAASPRFVDVVRQNLLQAGVVAPAQAPPGAATAVS